MPQPVLIVASKDYRVNVAILLQAGCQFLPFQQYRHHVYHRTAHPSWPPYYKPSSQADLFDGSIQMKHTNWLFVQLLQPTTVFV